jgi:hypothetical protein
MGNFTSSSSESKNTTNEAHALSFIDHLTGRCISLPLFADGKSQSQPPSEQRAPIMRVLELVKAAARFFALRSPPGLMHRQLEPLQPLGFPVAEYRPCVPVRVVFCCVAVLCQPLAAAPADTHVTCSTTWRWAECVMQRDARSRAPSAGAAAAARAMSF